MASPVNSSSTTHPGVLHQYSSKLVAFEHIHPSSSNTTSPNHINKPLNTVLFISGLGDGFLTVPYTTQIAAALPTNWTLTEVLLSASYTGWGISSLSQDAKEMSDCVTYFRALRGPDTKIILMGHSTGCQDVMRYLTTDNHPRVQGAILQAPCSDREAMVDAMNSAVYDEGVKEARRMLDAGKGEEIISRRYSELFGGSPVTARRWLSLASPDHQGDDDCFSSDLGDDRLRDTFGRVPAHTPLCILMGEKDEFVPKWVDKKGLIGRWKGFVEGRGVDQVTSGVIPGATHSLINDPSGVVEDLVLRVARFVERCASDDVGESS